MSKSPSTGARFARLTRVLALSTLGLASSAPVVAASYSLEEAVDHALENNPRLGSSEAAIREAEEELTAARSAGGPRVDLSFSGKASNNPMDAFGDKLQAGNIEADFNQNPPDLGDFDPDTLNDPDSSTLLTGEVNVSYPVYTGGRLEAGVRGAQSARQAASRGHLRAREVVAYQTYRAYLGVQAAERGLRVAEEAVATAEEHVETTRELVRQGRIVESDRLTAEVNLAEMRAGEMEARRDRRRARNRLRLAMGLDNGDSVEVEPLPDAAEHEADLAELPELQRQALEGRHDLRSLRAQLAAQRAAVDGQRAEHGPSVNLVATGNSYGESEFSDNTSWRVMGVINYRLYDGGVVSSRTAAARQRVAAVQAEIRSRQQAIRNEVQSAHDDIQVARMRLDSTRGNVERARRNVALVDDRYGQGRTILIDLLQAEGGLVKARQEALGASIALHNGLADLALAQGRVLELFDQE